MLHEDFDSFYQSAWTGHTSQSTHTNNIQVKEEFENDPQFLSQYAANAPKTAA